MFVLRNQVGEFDAQSFGDFHKLEVANPAGLKLDSCKNIATNVPAEALAAGGQLRLRKIELIANLPYLRSDNILERGFRAGIQTILESESNGMPWKKLETPDIDETWRRGDGNAYAMYITFKDIFQFYSKDYAEAQQTKSASDQKDRLKDF